MSKGLSPDSVLVSEIITATLRTMDQYLPMDQANQFMYENKIRHLIVTEEEKVVGVLSVKDLVSYYAKSFRMQE